ncbi:transposase [Escherichia coli]|uniref:transposase n=2 Tax=Escherichia coli TaxID=562 RepID=UPI002359B2FD|nr:transposase [Escherichia coli]MDC9197232.1 transposase [Escherichia coli]
MLQELCRVRRPGRTTHASVGVELPVSAAFPVCQPARDHGVGAGHRLPRHCHAPVKKAGHTHQVAKTGAVTLIQRFGSALNLNVHFHMLFLDGVYVEQSHGSARFRWVKAPTTPELTQLTHTIAHRVGRYLERQGLLERDVENSYLASDAVDDDPMTPCWGTRSLTVSLSVHRRGERCSLCKLCRPVVIRSVTDWQGSRVQPARRRGGGPMNARSSNGCAGTSAARRYPRSGCR